MLYQLVLLLPGNTYCCNVEEKDIPSMEKSVLDIMDNPTLSLKLKYDKRNAYIRSSSILGFYFKPYEKSTDKQVLDLLKIVAQPPEDNWKTSIGD